MLLLQSCKQRTKYFPFEGVLNQFQKWPHVFSVFPSSYEVDFVSRNFSKHNINCDE